MKAIFTDSQRLEQAAKEGLHFPPFLMMENAAAELERAVIESAGAVDCTPGGESVFKAQVPFPAPIAPPQFQCLSQPRVLIVCGRGNNGGDGYALARRLFGKLPCRVVALSAPKTEEAIAQRTMAEAAGVPIASELPSDEELSQFSMIVDCILGTGFSGALREPVATVIERLNCAPGYKIACDIPTGLQFHADRTITMGCLKTALFTDEAKQACGKITVADLGIQREIFEGFGTPDAFLIEKDDIKLPLRKNAAAHKGNFGRTAVFAGEKSGAGIIAASAALNFGSGLSSLIRTENSNLAQFKISPELMISDEIPANATCVLIGSGLGVKNAEAVRAFENWFCAAKNPACVLDADIFYYDDFCAMLERLNAVQNARIILTPHPKELKVVCERLFPDEVALSVSQISRNRIEIGKKIAARFANVTVVMKSANTFIDVPKTDSAAGGIFICANGSQSLAKAGSGDVLAGMCAALLAQGYTARDAAITAVYAHAAASNTFTNGEGYDLSPEKLINAFGIIP